MFKTIAAHSFGVYQNCGSFKLKMAAAGSASKISVKNLHDYLKTLSQSTLEQLYNHPATCLAVFRDLPELARQYIMRMLFVEQPITQAVVTSWINTRYYKDHLQNAQALKDLQLWCEVPMPGGLPGWLLNATFRKNMKIALLGGGNPWATTASLDSDKHAKDIPFLDNYAMERWECILHFMVGSHTNEGISNDTKHVLIHAGLMATEEGNTSPTITSSGFQFLLMDTSSQVWYFMLQYLDTIENRKLSLVDCLSFVFQLSFSTLGKDYSTEGMTESMLVFLQHLREFGLVFQRKRRSGRFYPTRLAINLASGLQTSDIDMHRPGFLAVETNYRVYAYTDSNLQIALLGLFCELLYRFPNLCVGIISRESVRQALRSGITADQIISFLRMHAHAETLKQDPVIPPTITDQIKLWELERDRFIFSEGVLYSQFLSQEDFECLRNYAQDLSVLVWENPQKRVMIVSRSGHDDVKRFWKRQKSS